ncbi:hypothetical protein FOZ60_016847, partial [Perkinsus olseni]
GALSFLLAMAYLPAAAQDLIAKCCWFLQSRRKLILGTSVALILALRALKFMRRPKVDLHACFGGPNRFPTFGLLSRERLHRALEILADTYGGVYCIKIQQVLAERPNTYIRLFNKNNIQPFTGMVTTEGEKWKRTRRLGAPSFNDVNSAAMVPDMTRVAKKLVRQLRVLSQDGRIVWSPTEWIPLCTLDTLCVTCFGNDYNFLNPDGVALGRSPREIQRALRDTIVGSGHASILSNFPWMTRDRFPWNLNPFIKKLHLGVERLNELCDEIASKREAERQAGVQAARQDLLDKLMDIDREDLRGNIITFFIAGGDTAASAVAWCLYYLCLNPCIQSKARAEVDALGRDPETMTDVDELPLVECCVLEALRLQPPTVMILLESITETSLNGKTIPSGTAVVTLLRKAMVQESQGGTIFKPERWLTHDGSAVDRLRTREHLAFGGGPRQCPGQRMAIIETTIIVTLILRHFNDLRFRNSSESVRGEMMFNYGPKNLELVMFPRHH